MTIYRNPTEAEVADATRGGRPMRMLLERETGDVIAWPAEEGLHADIMRELNLSEDAADNLGSVRSYEDYKRLVDWVGR